MPMKKKMPARRRPAVRRAPRRVARRTNNMNVGEFASCSVSRSVTSQNGNQMYDYSTFQLADFPRAVAVARAYQYFRITGIKVTWKPKFDTYIAVAGPGVWKPQLYYMIDKSASIPTSITLESLKNMGARPRAFDEKPISVQWKPAVNTGVQNVVGTTYSQYKISPWLSTNLDADLSSWSPSTVQHNGLIWYMETPGGVQTFDLDIELQFQFKKPLVDRAPSVTRALPLVYAVEDNSPDGVEGGSDGITLHTT